MAGNTVFSGQLWVHYSQAYVRGSEGLDPDMRLAFGGQENGLCGAGVAGALFLTIGLHTGRVPFTVEVHDGPPPFGSEWEDIVEVSFAPAPSGAMLSEWGGGDGPYPLGLGPGDWRVRYCATGMDAAHNARPVRANEQPIDRYLLQFWPQPPGIDRVVRQTSEKAGWSHEHARSLPPPPTPEELEEARRREEREAEARRVASRQARLRFEWGGRLPSDRLLDVGGPARALAHKNRDLLDALARTGPEGQRAVAVWAAHQACELAGLTALDWVVAGLDALDAGRELPAPFDATGDAFTRLEGPGPRVLRASTALSTERTRPQVRIDLRYAALPSIRGAAHEDPLRAAVEALNSASATFHEDDARLFDGLRAAFPELD